MKANRRILRCRDVGRYKLLHVIILLGCACVHVNGTRRSRYSKRSYIFRNAPAWLTRERSTSGGTMQRSWIIPELRKGLRRRTFHGALARVRGEVAFRFNFLSRLQSREHSETRQNPRNAKLLSQCIITSNEYPSHSIMQFKLITEKKKKENLWKQIACNNCVIV